MNRQVAVIALAAAGFAAVAAVIVIRMDAPEPDAAPAAAAAPAAPAPAPRAPDPEPAAPEPEPLPAAPPVAAVPVVEAQKHSAYEGCYALSKVLEEVMLEQYYIQYDFNGCCLRAPWIMEKDDFRYTLSFGEDVFGGPRWRDLVGAEKADQYAAAGTVPVMLDAQGEPMLRNFVHVEDLTDAIVAALGHPAARQQLFNICMDEPVDYRIMADYLYETRGLPSVDIPTDFHRTWLDNNKAKFVLDWRPEYDLADLIDSAWEYQRADDDPRKIWYPG